MGRVVLVRASPGILLSGFLAGAAYLPFALQLMLGSGFLAQTTQTITFYFFPVCWAVMGLGFVVPLRLSERAFRLACAFIFLIYLACALLVPVIADSQAFLAARIFVCWVPAAALYFLIGQRLSAGLVQAGPRLHFDYGMFLVLMAAGGIFSDQAVKIIGGNGLLVFLAAAPLISGLRWKFVLPAAIAAAAALVLLKADLHIERFRRGGQLQPAENPSAEIIEPQRKGSAKNFGLEYFDNYREAFSKVSWNRRGMSFMYRHEDLKAHVGVVNLQPEHLLPFIPEAADRPVSAFKKDQNILLIGAGSGRTVAVIPQDVLGKNISVVERDANTVRLMLENGLNPNLGKVNYVARDGRAFVEQSNRKWDWIILESSVQQRNVSPFQLFQPHNLYTAEAYETYRSHLREGGTLVIEINRPEERSRQPVASVSMSAAKKFREDGAQMLAVMKNPEAPSSNSGPLLIFVRPGGEPLTRASLGIPTSARAVGDDDYEIRECVRGYSDAKPFLDWSCMVPVRKRAILFYTFWLLGLLTAAYSAHAVFFVRPAPGRSSINSIFICQSIAHCSLFLAVSYFLRSAFVDEIGTFYVFTFSSTLIASFASFFVDYRLTRGKIIPAGAVAWAMFGSLVWLFLFLRTDIASFDGMVVRFGLLLAGIFPFYFFSSLMFHVNLQRAKFFEGGIKQALLFDSLALIPMYLVTPWVLFDRGIPYLFGCAVLFYGVMLMMMGRLERIARVDPIL